MKALTTNSVSDMESMVQSYIIQGYNVAHKTDSTVTLVKPKQFNWIIAVAGFMFLFIGLFIYLGYYMTKKDEVITINVKTQSIEKQSAKAV